ncbi:retinal guanylyl cyclase 2-like [Ylistrum balloti]|uniref:retinal guanylyl cyclase 2-like n=1 Tax=Ylistrum balloti TaxID=509963 RepID=UPI002905872E|nr:retinal guanylyl cyclase 2-like [Ylistrum balloti]
MRCGCVRLSDLTRISWTVEWCLIAVLCSSVTYCPVIQATQIDIAVIFIDTEADFTVSNVQTLAQTTQNSFSNNMLLGSTIVTHLYSCTDELDVMNKAEGIFANTGYDVIIDFTSDRISSLMYMYAEIYQKPLVFANSFYSRTCDPFVVSMYGSYATLADGLAEYLRQFRWGNLAFVITGNPQWRHVAYGVQTQLQKHKYTVTRSVEINDFNNNTILLEQLQLISSSAKGVVLAMDAEDAYKVLQSAQQWAGLTQHSFFLLVRNPYANILDISAVLTQNLNISDALGATFLLFPTVPNVLHINESGATIVPHVQTKSFAALEDAYVTIFQGYSSLYNKSVSNINGLTLTSEMKVVNSDLSGRSVQFDVESCSRYLEFALYDFRISDSDFSVARHIWQGCNSAWCSKVFSSIEWPKGVALPGDACFLQPNCAPTESGVNIVLAVAIPLTLVTIGGVVAMVLFLLWRRKNKRLMTKGPNKVLLEPDDLTFLHRKDIKTSKLTNGGFLDPPDLLKASEKSNRSLISLHEWTEFSEIARYKGDIVYIKELKYKGLEMKGKILAYTRTLRDIRHENVNPLYGFLNDPIRPALVSEHCNRGSLQDVLNNENIKLDWDFKASLLTDLVRGLRYIHTSPIHFHGSLKSRNCVVDSRWVLKLTDFGMIGFRERAKLNIASEAGDLLWTAPEHVRDPYPCSKGSEKGDMYGMAIVMQEVILRKRPFGMVDLTEEEIIEKIRKPPPLLRPSVSPQAAQPQYIQIMKQCWSENPDMRPSIEDVYQQFKSVAGGKKMNIVDSMFRMLEKYSNDLEDIVKERTVQLEEEKKKTDVLLNRMLPAVVADGLKSGQKINAETFEEVTIYFSDVVGFTTISAMSTPMQVVDLLNDLYTAFDACIDNYDVYKVETIGDAYMVVSGLPVRNENRHAGEIGTMALDLLSICGTFKIRHMPEVPLRLRIGLHTGSCVAGVVGLTMPRYCLFGDTVNTASRMESTGSAFRIHISLPTKKVLDDLGGYQLEYRGEVELKGKGLAKTYWLVGKDGFSKPLPEPPPMNDESNHGLESVLKAQKLQNLQNSNATAESSTPEQSSSTTSKAETNNITVTELQCACCDQPKSSPKRDSQAYDSNDNQKGKSGSSQANKIRVNCDICMTGNNQINSTATSKDGITPVANV